MKCAKKSVVEKHLLPGDDWKKGFWSFVKEVGASAAHLCLIEESGTRLLTLTRRGLPLIQSKKKALHKKNELLLRHFVDDYLSHKDDNNPCPIVIKSSNQRVGAIFSLKHYGRFKGFLYVSALDKRVNWEKHPILDLFAHFMNTQVELAYKEFELNNFYETVHPRALALSTLHSVHRVISSSLRLQDLLPRIGRLSAQVLKARGCSIMLVDADQQYLSPYFSFGEHPRLVNYKRVKIGRGIQGKIALTGEYYLTRKAIGVPFIEDDIVGVIALWDKGDGKYFSRVDLEILKSLSEQAVVAIKNARLFEETEQLTLGSIKTINELLELNFGGDRKELESIACLVSEIGRDLELSTREQTFLERAVLLLDTGALALGDKMLLKKGKLTEEEFSQIRRIPSEGANILRSISSLQPVIPIILHHHERYDGKGYPQGLKGDEIPIGARIVSVVNSFIAMLSKRAYRDLMSIDQAIKEIKRNQKTQFDPQVVDSFVRIIKKKDVREKVAQLMKKDHAKKSAKLVSKS